MWDKSLEMATVLDEDAKVEQMVVEKGKLVFSGSGGSSLKISSVIAEPFIKVVDISTGRCKQWMKRKGNHSSFCVYGEYIYNATSYGVRIWNMDSGEYRDVKLNGRSR